MSKTLAIVQARQGSERFPGKTLAPLGGQPVLGYLLSRLCRAETLDRIVVATSTDATDHPIYAYMNEYGEMFGAGCFLGHPTDVLARYYEAAKFYRPDVVVRVTGDCPLIDPALVDRVVLERQNAGVDYCALLGWPDGADCEAMTFAALERAHWEATMPSDREHVAPFIWREGSPFTKLFIQPAFGEDVSGYRFTLDYPEDLLVLRRMAADLTEPFGVAEMVDWAKCNPQVIALNSMHTPNEGYALSLEQDKAVAS